MSFDVVALLAEAPSRRSLIDAMAAHGRQGRGLQLVTPSSSRITHALRSVLTGPRATWVVRAPDDRYYDGFNGLPLVWEPETGFVPDPGTDAQEGPNEAFRGSGHELGAQLLVSLQVDHPATKDLRLGGAAELLAELLGGAPPALWGVNEPLSRAWNAREVTAMARQRAPGRTWLAFTGPPEGSRPLSGTQRVSRTPTGVRENILCAVGYRHDEEPEVPALPEIVRELTSRGVLRTMTVHRLGGRPDLTYAPRWSGVSTPVGLAVGVEAVASMGAEHALAAPVRGVPCGPPMTPSVWYPIGDGTEPDGWTRFRALTEHLKPTARG